MSNVREVQQARATSATLATLTGKPGQLIVNKDSKAVHVMDGATAGGVAMVGTAAQTLTEAQQEQVLTNLGIPQVFNVPNSAAAHNALFRGENLLSGHFASISALSSAIQSGNFEDIFIGDYFDVSMTSSYATETVRWVVAGIDTFLHNGDTEITSHHLAMIPEDCFATAAQMNATDTAEGSYYNSAMHQTVLSAYATALKNAIGSGHVLNHRQLLANAMTASTSSMAGAGWTGASTNWSWYDCDLVLLNEVQVYGCTAFSSSFFDIGNRNQQLPYFALRQDKKVANLGRTGGRYAWWLSPVTSSARFARVGGDGNAGDDNASWSFGVRPLFLFV